MNLFDVLSQFSSQFSSKMGKTCCVYDCNTNYKSEIKRRKLDDECVHVYRVPNPKKFPKQHADWVSILTKINANLNITNETVVCSKHWPPHKPTFLHYGKERPVDPPSVYSIKFLPASCRLPHHQIVEHFVPHVKIGTNNLISYRISKREIDTTSNS